MRQMFGWSYLFQLILPLHLFAQTTLSPGDRVRVSEPNAEVWTGELVHVSPTALVLRPTEATLTVSAPLQAQILVERNEVGVVRKYLTPFAAATGLMGGISLVGGVISVISAVALPDKFDGTLSEAFVWGAVGGAIFSIPYDLLVIRHVRGERWVTLPPPGSDGGAMALSPGDWVRVREPDARVWTGEFVEMSGTKIVLIEDGSASPVAVPVRSDLLFAQSVGPSYGRRFATALISGAALGLIGGSMSVLSANSTPGKFRGRREEVFLWGATGGAILGTTGGMIWGWGRERWVPLPPPGSITVGPGGNGSLELSIVLPLGGRAPSY